MSAMAVVHGASHLGRLWASARLVLMALCAASTVPLAGAWAQAAASPAAAAVGQPETEVAPPVLLLAGKSSLMRLPSAIERISVGNPNVVDVTLTGPRELYLLGKTFGTSNLILWRKGGAVTVVDITVELDTSALRQNLATLLPGEKGIEVRSAADSIVLAGTVSSALKAEHAVSIAEGFLRANLRSVVAAGQGIGATPQATNAAQPAAAARGTQSGTRAQVINLLTVVQPQQVMLEVKVAEVSRSMLEQLGVSLNLSRVAGSVTWGLITRGLQDAFGTITGTQGGSGNRGSVDGKFDDGLVKILAEPTIVSSSGQEGSFLAGGKVFIPVARANDQGGGTTITLEEKEFGVGLRFTPVVLDGDIISLRVAPEVSELSRTGSPFVSANGVTTVLPSFTTRRAETTVQLRDGQTLAIAGLIKNNVTENVSRFPFLGELPILGALFRSTEFLNDRSELLFVITPRLVSALGETPALPTDGFSAPSRSELILRGQLEGTGRPGVSARPQSSAAGQKDPVDHGK